MDKNGNVEQIYQLSPLQLGMLFHTLDSPGTGMYFQQFSFIITGHIDKSAFEHAWQKAMDRHSVLRTLFKWDTSSEPVQIVLRDVKALLEYYDWSNLPHDKLLVKMEEYLYLQRNEGFDLSKPPLMRLTLIQTSTDSYRFVWSHHHLILDGWSLHQVLKDVMDYYKTFCEGYELRINSCRQYIDYIKWLKQQDLIKAENFWRNKLAGFTPFALPRMTADKNTEVLGKINFCQKEVKLSVELTALLRTIARKYRITVNTIVHGAWAILLNRYSGEDDIGFGSIVSGRPADLADVENIVGLFINTLPVRINIKSKHISLLDWLVELQNELAESRQYEYTPLFQIQKWSDIKQGEALFDSIVVFENFPVDDSLHSMDLNLKFKLEPFVERTSFPLTLVVTPGEQLMLQISFHTNKYNNDEINRLLKHLVNILTIMIHEPHIPLSDIELISLKEKQMILFDFNNTEADYPKNRTIHNMFEEQVRKTPDSISVVSGSKSLTYEKLDDMANRLASMLWERGVRNGSIIPIIAERSIEMIIGIFAVLKAGGTYLPIDPDYPAERISYILKDSNAKTILTKSCYTNILNYNIDTIFMDDETIYCGNLADFSKAGSSGNMAYVIYTSGSTGHPKGVMIEHRSVVNRINWMQKKYTLNTGDVILQKTPFVFDVSVWELFWWSFVGASVYLLQPGGEKDPNAIVEAIYKKNITIMHFVPSMMNAFLDYMECCNDGYKIKSLKHVFSSGEALSIQQVERFNRLVNKVNGARLSNLYGPTEATVDVTYFDCPIEKNLYFVPIGKPIDNTRLYILDRNKKLLPVGITGELYISGDGVGRGYLNKPELTKERFITDPFFTGNRMYKTGDLARWMDDGNIEFLGRSDHQVKIRGFRIEPGEIEAELLKHKMIMEAVVLYKEDADLGYLCAYVVASEKMDIQDLKEYLSKMLPVYMIPSKFVFLDRMPHTNSGKIDRKALPEPDNNVIVEAEHGIYENEMVEMLRLLWSKILKVDNIKENDDFFRLGGHSLKVAMLSTLLYKNMNISFPIRELLLKRTIKEQAEYISNIPGK